MSFQRFKPALIKISAGFILLFLIAVVSTLIAVFGAVRHRFRVSTIAAKVALPIVRGYDNLSFHHLPVVQVWRASLELLSLSDELSRAVRASASPSANGEAYYDLSPLSRTLPALTDQLTILSTALPRSFVSSALVPDQFQSALEEGIPLLQLGNQLLPYLATGTHRWLILFQNHHELRASGGFMGSYALLTLQDGKVTELVVEDIYDADGQFRGFVTAPPGVHEYLSDNRGLRLPDANWDADFPSSAQTTLQYFALGKRQGIDLVTAVTLEAGQSLLDVIGPVYLPDQSQYVNADNISEILGSHRDSFFPGSIQKKQLMQQLLTQVRLKLADLPASAARPLINTVQTAIIGKQVQAYATDPALQQLFVRAGVAGELGRPQHDLLYLVESNVGINKVNKWVSRTVNLTAAESELTVEIDFLNDAPTASRSAYINYQRILVPSGWQLDNVSVSGQRVLEISSQTRQVKGEKVTEYGFLVVVPEHTHQIAQIQFNTNGQFLAQPLLIQKQPGLPSTPYQLTFAQQDKRQEQRFELTEDMTLSPDGVLQSVHGSEFER